MGLGRLQGCKMTNQELIKYDKRIIDYIDKKQIAYNDRMKESIEVYRFIKREYARGDVENNLLFQFVFRSFYRLDNAGLTDKWKKAYFRLLADNEKDLKTILNKLYVEKNHKGQSTVQFSFATKLLHTLDNTKPIFDSEVSKVLGLELNGKGKSKIVNSERVYTNLINIFKSALQKPIAQKKIAQFKLEYHASDLNDEKILDFILWDKKK